MHSKTSKKLNNPTNTSTLWKAVSGSSEESLGHLALELAHQLKLGDRVLLEGPMGVGKTTFARSLLLGLGVHQPPEGSPSFAIAHEYSCNLGGVIHIDYYRLKDESEIDDAGIPSYYWERNLVVISEWLSSWETFHDQVLESGRVWTVDLAFDEENTAFRQAKICLNDQAKQSPVP